MAPEFDDNSTVGQSQEEAELQFDEVDNATEADDDHGKMQPDPVEELRSELQQANERVLRSQAELENFRRRMRRERDEERRYAFQPLLADLLPVIDNIDRAMEAAEGVEDSAGLLQGFKMVAQQLQDVLQQHHCSLIEAADAPFDPTLHEALAQQPSDEVPAGTVVGVHQQGYLLHDRVIRPAQVIVSKEADQ